MRVAVVSGVSVLMAPMVVRRGRAGNGSFGTANRAGRVARATSQGSPGCRAASPGDQARWAGACRSSHITTRAIQSMRAG